VGAQSATGRHRPTPDLVRAVLGHLADRVATRLRARHRAGRTVTVRVRFPARGSPSRSVTRSLTLDEPIAGTLTLTEIAEELAWQAIEDRAADQDRAAGEEPVEISLLGVSVSNLVVQHLVQLELPLPPPDPRRPGSATGAARWAVDLSVDAVRARFGRSAVGYLPATLAGSAGVPDEFRGLAEREA